MAIGGARPALTLARFLTRRWVRRNYGFRTVRWTKRRDLEVCAVLSSCGAVPTSRRTCPESILKNIFHTGDYTVKGTPLM